MRLLIILCLLFCSGMLLFGLLLLLRPVRAWPLYIQVEEGAENLEWLFTVLLRQAPRRQLLVIDLSGGENRRILRALARRYHLGFVAKAPPGAPTLYARQGVTAQQLLKQYADLDAAKTQTQEKAGQGGA